MDVKGFLKDYTTLSTQMERIKKADFRLNDPYEYAAKQREAQFDVSTGSGLSSGTAAVTIPLCVIPPNVIINGGGIRFGAMGASATVDIGIFGADLSGRIDDTLATSTIAGTTLVTGEYYQIEEAGGDFSTVGAPNNRIGTVFKATGTTPTTGKKVRQVGTGNDRDFFLDGISVATAGYDTFADIVNDDSNYWYKTLKPLFLVAVADGADWAASKTLKGFVKFVQH